jgi:hypothetical protein
LHPYGVVINFPKIYSPLCISFFKEFHADWQICSSSIHMCPSAHLWKQKHANLNSVAIREKSSSYEGTRKGVSDESSGKSQIRVCGMRWATSIYVHPKVGHEKVKEKSREWMRLPVLGNCLFLAVWRLYVCVYVKLLRLLTSFTASLYLRPSWPFLLPIDSSSNSLFYFFFFILYVSFVRLV